MFFHNFKYTFKILFKNKMLIFWTFAFPIILGTFFNLAFSNIENSEKLEVIDIAIVDDDNYNNNNMIFKESFKALSDDKSDNQLFNTKYVNLDEAKILLTEKEITGYLVIENNNPKIVVNSSGINETIFKHVVEEITQTIKIVDNLDENQDFNKNIYNDVLNIMQEENVKLNNISNNNLSYTMIEFYTLIAMTCLYGGIIGMTTINYNLANMSSKGKRVSITPVSKGKVILGSLAASYIVQVIGLTLLMLFTIFVLNVDFGNNLFLVVLLALVGSLAGLCLGIAIGTLMKSNENLKMAVLISITMLGCFLSGMMGITMKYVIDKNIPIINKINPASMITDGFYSLYYYDTLNRYLFNIISLIIFAFIMICLSYKGLRRQKYDSI